MINEFKKITSSKKTEEYIYDLIIKNKYQVIAISGASGSGKTTLSKKLAQLSANQITIINIDDYFKYNLINRIKKKISGYSITSRKIELFLSHINSLKKGEIITKPVFSYSTQEIKKEKEKVAPKKIILIEGTLDFRDIADFVIFTWAPEETLINRIVKRGGYTTVFKTKKSLKKHTVEVSMKNYREKLLPFIEKSDLIYDTYANILFKK